MKKALSFILISVFLVLSGCASQNTASVIDNTNSSLVSEGTSWDSTKGVTGYQTVYENESFMLQLDGSTCEIAVLDKATQKTYYSNPQERDTDSIAKAGGVEMLKSQLIVYYKNNKGETFQYYTSSDSLEYEQFDFEKIENGVRVTYVLGKQNKRYIYPPRISKSRMEEFKEKMSDEDKESLEFLYYLIDLDEMTEEDRKAYTAESPQLEDVPQFYNVEGLFRGSSGITKIPEYISEEAEAIFARAGYTEEDMEQDYAQMGLEFPEDKNAVIQVAIEYTLDEHGLLVNVPNSLIEFDETKFHVTEVDVLPYFGAASSEDKGYILVPDGSGALIELNNGKTQYDVYKKLLYGSDKSINYSKLQTDDGTNAYLPVFGLKTENSCFVGIVENGDGSCSITADVGGRYHSYNHTSPVFLITPNALVDESTTLAALDYQEDIISSDLTVRYLFMSDDSLSYSGMANAVREYYLKTGKLKKSENTKQNGISLNLIAAVKGQKTFMGYEYNSVYPLTTYSQVSEIIDWFELKGITNLNVVYEGWGNDSYDNGLAKQAKTLNALGGKSGFKDLIEYSKNKGITLVPDVNFMYVSQQSASGFSESKYASRNIQGSVATEIKYEYGTMRESLESIGRYIVKPAAFTGLSESFFEKYSSYGCENIYLNNIGTDLNSDYHRDRLTDRTQAQDYTEQLLEKSSALHNVTVSGGNSYTLKYTDRIIDFPLESGKSYIIDREIPFVAMVLNGSIKMNSLVTSDHYSNWYTLKLIEAGIYPQFEMIYSDISQLREAESDIICGSFETLRDEAVSIYQDVHSALKYVNGMSIVSHSEIQPNVTATKYENGYTVIVNFTENTVTVNDITIEGCSWTIVEGE